MFSAIKLCSIESMMQAYSGSSLHMLVNVPKATYVGCLLLKPLDIQAGLQGTPLAPWWNPSRMSEPFILNNIANALRLATLYSHGGLYFDTDIIHLSPVSLENFLARQDAHAINNAAMGFRQGHPLVNDAMKLFVKDYNGFAWANQGPVLLTKLCGLSHKCPEVTILDQHVFYPVHHTQSIMFSQPYDPNVVSNETRGIHVWNKVLKLDQTTHNSLIAHLFHQSCPLTHRFVNGSQPSQWTLKKYDIRQLSHLLSTVPCRMGHE